jgi:hypothetical protein
MKIKRTKKKYIKKRASDKKSDCKIMENA